MAVKSSDSQLDLFSVNDAAPVELDAPIIDAVPSPLLNCKAMHFKRVRHLATGLTGTFVDRDEDKRFIYVRGRFYVPSGPDVSNDGWVETGVMVSFTPSTVSMLVGHFHFNPSLVFHA